MKKLHILFIALAFALLCVNVFGQTTNYPFKVQISGHGKQSIVFIPGFASSGDVWNETKANFENKYTCYTLTMAGFAGVPAQSGASFAGWENAIASYIKANHINKPILVGHSMGGGFALAIAADYPELIDKIVVVDALPCLAAMMNPAFKAKENNDCGPMVAQFTKMSDEQFKQMQQKTMPQLLADTGRLKQVVDWSVTSDRTTFAQMYCDFMNTDLRQKISTIKCPSLILLEANFATYSSAVDEQYANLKTATKVYAQKGLHFIMYDDTAWYDKQLTGFIK